MIGSIGVPEMLIILVIALIIFGPRKLPELGRSLGKSLGEFKRASNDLRNTLDEEIRIEERREQAETAKKASETPAEPAEATPASSPAPAKTAAAPASGVHPTEPDVGT